MLCFVQAYATIMLNDKSTITNLNCWQKLIIRLNVLSLQTTEKNYSKINSKTLKKPVEQHLDIAW